MIKEDQLIARCRAGDPAAYTMLYNQHAAAVYSSILRLTGHTAEAEDILQDSFVAAFEGIAGYREIGTFKAWVKRIAINKSVDLIRKRKLHFVEMEVHMMPEREDEVVDEQGFAYTMEAVNRAIEALPPNYRTIFNLYAMEEIPHAEIAQMLGIENGTVRTQYHRAKQKLLETLKRGGYDER